MCDYNEKEPAEEITESIPEEPEKQIVEEIVEEIVDPAREEQRRYEEDDYESRRQVENPDAYRKSPEMRAEQEREADVQSRYSFDNTGSGRERMDYQQNTRRSSGKKKKNKTALIIVLVALGVGALVGGLCWSAGRIISSIGSESESSVAAALPSFAGEDSQEPASEEEGSGTILENSGDAVIPSAATGELAEDSVLITDVPDVVDMCMPSIVAITTTYVYENYNTYGYNPFFGYGNGNGYGGSSTYEATGAGSGIIIGDDGEEVWIVTNNHVVEDSNEVKVGFNDGEVVTAYIKGTDVENDLAVVGVKLADMKDTTKSAIRAIQIGDSTTLRLGETVIAIGNALGIGQSVTTGIVSAVDRVISTSNSQELTTIQTDAAINPGNSGGALLNSRGQLIGINVAKDVEENVEGMGYAIPISNAIEIIEKLTTMHPRTAVADSEYPYLGVQLKDIDSSYAKAYNIPTGIMVYVVETDGPADKAGILTQDIITKFNDVAVSSYEDLKNELQYYAGGTKVTVTVSRIENGAYVEHVLDVTLGLKSDYVKEESTAAADDTQNSQDNGSGFGGNFGSFGGFDSGKSGR